MKRVTMSCLGRNIYCASKSRSLLHGLDRLRKAINTLDVNDNLTSKICMPDLSRAILAIFPSPRRVSGSPASSPRGHLTPKMRNLCLSSSCSLIFADLHLQKRRGAVMSLILIGGCSPLTPHQALHLYGFGNTATYLHPRCVLRFLSRLKRHLKTSCASFRT
jgi:hypothetical protein